MDKYEYNLKLDEITKLVEQENYQEAGAIADTIDWRRVRNVRTLCMVSEIYEAGGRLAESRDILLRAYKKSKAVRSILFRLTEISIKLKEFDDAAEYYSEFVNAAPHDNSRYLLKYMIYRGRGSAIEDQIAILEEYNQKEYTEKYAYEVAKLYYRIGNLEKCVEACDELILWFRQGKYVIRALELKQQITDLTPVQQAIYDNRNEATLSKPEMVEAVVPDLEKVLVENMPESTKEVITDDVINVTEKELAQIITEHTAAQNLEAENKKEETPESGSEDWGFTPKPAQSTASAPAKDYGFNTADLQAELAKSMRDIVSGITRKPDESDIVEPVNDIVDQEETPIAMPQDDNTIEGQMTIDDILLSMSNLQQEESAAAAEKEEPAEEISEVKEKPAEEVPEVKEAVKEELAEEVPEVKEAVKEEPAEEVPEVKEAVKEEPAQEVPEIKEKAVEAAKTRNIAEAIASEPMPEPEKIPTELTEDQQYIFSYFATIGGLKEQLAGALYAVMKKMNSMDMTSRTGNMVILGAEGSGKSALGIRFAKCISQEKGEETAKVAKIYAEDFNKKDIPSTVAKIAGGTLIIEEAGDLDDAVVEQLSKAMEFRTDALLVILEDEKKYLKELFEKHPAFAEKFTAEVVIPVFTNDELVSFGRMYAYDEDYKIDDEAMVVLYERIGEIQASGQPVTVIDVKEIVDAAIKRSERTGIRKLGMILSHKRYDEDDRVILYEKDFR